MYSVLVAALGHMPAAPAEATARDERPELVEPDDVAFAVDTDRSVSADPLVEPDSVDPEEPPDDPVAPAAEATASMVVVTTEIEPDRVGRGLVDSPRASPSASEVVEATC